MTVEEFIKTFVRISLLPNENTYGHYPFQLVAEMKDGKMEFNALALGGDVASCYKRFWSYKNVAEKVFMSLDFPGVEKARDFVAVISLIDGEVNIFAIPYDVATGEIFKLSHTSPLFDRILSDLNHFKNEHK